MKKIFIFSLFLYLPACGDSGTEKVSKGHRDAVRYECKDASDVKACGLQVMENFIESGNDFANLEDLTKAERKKIRLDCLQTKNFGLEAYNLCLEDLKVAAEDGTLWDKPKFTRKPQNNIEKLESITVRIDIIEKDNDGKIYLAGGGSGVTLDKDLLATNCHVALAALKPNRALVIKNINQENYAVAEIYKRAEEHDICIIKKINDSEFSFEMKPVRKLIKFNKLTKGSFVRAMGTPEGLEGHTDTGSINYLGLAGSSGHTRYGDYVISDDTKIISHDATIAPGSSGGPLFDKNGDLVGLNTFGGNLLNFAVSADHIKDLLKK